VPDAETGSASGHLEAAGDHGIRLSRGVPLADPPAESSPDRAIGTDLAR